MVTRSPATSSSSRKKGPPLFKNHKKTPKSPKTKANETNKAMLGFILIIALIALLALAIRKCISAGDPTNQKFEDWFRAKGGWMLPLLKVSATTEYGNGLVVAGGHKGGGATTISIKHFEKLLELPKSATFSKSATLQKLSASTRNTVLQAIKPLGDLEQQDALIAMDLMIECVNGKKSEWYPYLNMLPKNMTRLDSFSEAEYDLLQDADLKALGMASRKALVRAWNAGIHEAVNKTTRTAYKKPAQESCVTFEAFHLYVAVSSSHAMILDDVKYIVPMADMINHGDQPPSASSSSSGSSSSFQMYHQRAGDMIQVFSDRTFKRGQVIMEEYGKLDNSLYITAFGFVPKDNIHHCVMLPLPSPALYSGELKRLRKEYSDSLICVGANGSLMGDAIGEKLMAVLDESSSCNDDDEQVCQASGSAAQHLSTAARSILSNQKQLAEDVAMLEELLSSTSGDEWRGMNRDRARVALEFCIEEKKLLTSLLLL